MRGCRRAWPMLVLAGGAWAQVPPERVYISGYRVQTLASQATEGLSVIDRAEIERRAPATAPDLLRQLPGLQVDQLGGPGGLSSVYIRGSDPNHVLVLVDGVRVNDPTNSRGGGFDYSALDPAAIERIEVLRGPASALYGADAMGGVINIVLRRPQAGQKQAQLGAMAGGQDYRRAHARLGLGSQDGSSTLGLGLAALDDGADGEQGFVRLHSADLKAQTRLADWQLGFDARHTRRRGASFPDDSGGPEHAVLRELDAKHSTESAYVLRASWQPGRWTLSALASWFRHWEEIESPGVAPGQRSDFGVPASQSRTNFRRRNLLLSALLPLGTAADGADQLAFGLEQQHEHGLNNTEYSFFGQVIPADFDLRRHTRSLFAELQLQPSAALLLRGGLRQDRVSGLASRLSPSAGLRYELKPWGGALKASLASGFKPPSFFGLGLPEPLGGNPDLRAERSRGASVGYEQAFWGHGQLALSLFSTRYKDLITFDNASNKTVNANTAKIRGLELEFGWQLTRELALRVHYTRLLTHVVDSDEPLRQRPGKRAGLQLNYRLGADSQLSWSSEYIAEVFDSSIPTGNLFLPTALRSDLAYTARLGPRTRLTLALDNVFDRRNEAYVGFAAPGRRARLGLVFDY